MIQRSLQILTEQLNDYLNRSFGLREDIVFLSPIKDEQNVFPANRISIMLVGLGRETAGGVSFVQRPLLGQQFKQMAPTWQLHLNFLVTAVFQDKQYEESLRLLDGVTVEKRKLYKTILPH